MGNKIIGITGASGFVGKNLTRFLEQNMDGIEVCSISLKKDWKAHIKTDFSSIIHLAGKAHDLKKTSNTNEYFFVNRDLTKKIFDHFLASEARDFIFISSVKAVADVVVHSPLIEEVVPEPRTPYGLSKLQAEQYILSKPLPAGKRVFILRPCMIHGPGNKGNLNLLYQIVKGGIPYPLGAFENMRSFLSIENLLFVIHSLIRDNTIRSGIYNVADDEPLSTIEVVRVIAIAANKKARIYAPNKSFIKMLARIGDVLRLPLNTERLGKLTESYVVSNEKIKKALGIESFPISSREGMRRTIESFDVQNI